MICDFSSHMEVISFSNLDSLRLGNGQPTDLPSGPNDSERPTLHVLAQI